MRYPTRYVYLERCGFRLLRKACVSCVINILSLQFQVCLYLDGLQAKAKPDPKTYLPTYPSSYRFHSAKSSILPSMAESRYYDFDPSPVAAILATLLFGASAIFHTVQLCRARGSRFFISFLVGAYRMCYVP